MTEKSCIDMYGYVANCCDKHEINRVENPGVFEGFREYKSGCSKRVEFRRSRRYNGFTANVVKPLYLRRGNVNAQSWQTVRHAGTADSRSRNFRQNFREEQKMYDRKIRLLTIKEAAKLIDGLTEYRIRQMCINGTIPCFKAGKKYLINQDILFKTFI